MPRSQQLRRRIAKHPLLILEHLQRQPRIQLRIIAPPALELTVLVVLDEVVVGIAGEGERIQAKRIDARQPQQAQIRLGGFEVRRVEGHQVVANQKTRALRKPVQPRERSR